MADTNVAQQNQNQSFSDPKVYEKLNELLQSASGRAQVGDDPDKLAAINNFLQTYPYQVKKPHENESPMQKPWVDMTVRNLYFGSIQAAIEIINEVSAAISVRNAISYADFRRSIFEAFAKPSRRVYVGIWLIWLSFILYFIDSSA